MKRSSSSSFLYAVIGRLLLSTAIIAAQKENTVGTDEYTDENRPYKFAFAIEGYQHRSEQKDEKGIIMGEFGFVTGDGVYHETVYATDENGNFRIVSMKNYYIGLPGEVKMNIPLPMSVPPTTTPKARIAQTTPKKIELSGLQGCGGCLIPTTGTPAKARLPQSDINGMNKGYQENLHPTTKPDLYSSSKSKFTTKSPMTKNSADKILALPPKSPNNLYPPTNILTQRNPETPKTTNEIQQSEKQKPITDKDVSNKSNDQSELLYEFNQTQTFQGHHEKGYLDSSKEGNYFVNQRDGIKQVVEYIANDSGYQPYIRFVNLTASETPDPETEKIRNKLETMYFKWFYGSKRKE